MKKGEENILRKVLLGTVTMVGLVFVWRGLWESTERLFAPEVSLAIGAAVLVAVGYVSRKALRKKGII